MYIGLDLGTSVLKGILIDDEQTILAEATEALSVSRPHDGWSEQDPADWIRAAKLVLRALRAMLRRVTQSQVWHEEFHSIILLKSRNFK